MPLLNLKIEIAVRKYDETYKKRQESLNKLAKMLLLVRIETEDFFGLMYNKRVSCCAFEAII